MKDNDNADVTPRVVLGRAVPAGATVAYRAGDDGWDGWEIDVLEDPAAVLASDELVAVLDEPEPRPWPSAPLIRVWEGSDDGVVVDLAPPRQAMRGPRREPRRDAGRPRRREPEGRPVSRIDEIQARLDEALKVRPYEEQDRDEHKSKAWSDFYQHAPDDLAWLLDALARRDQRCEDLAVSLDEMEHPC